MNCHLAVDIGASSGRVIALDFNQKTIQLNEIHRFTNGIQEQNGHLCWDIHYLFNEILTGIELALAQHLNPQTIGIDTWAVDFVLLDDKDELLTDTISYRDHRTDGIMAETFKKITKEILYARTGIQFQQFNTLYQLEALKKSDSSVIEKAKTFLMIPDYLNFLLTGQKFVEYTNATTTQLINGQTRQWDEQIMQTVGIDESIFPEIIEPGTKIGSLTTALQQRFGQDITVIAPATHDTASAILSVPCTDEDIIYLSSGTWSLMGIEISNPIMKAHALKYNFTNEGSMNQKIRFLKNIMGMWMIQEIRKQYDHLFSFSELVTFAKKHAEFPSIIDVNDARFLSPDDMLQAIRDYCAETHQPIPYEIGEFTSCVYNSLAVSYAQTVQEIEAIVGTTYDAVYVIGGGSKNEYLNQLIANHTNKRVYAGLEEATAIGNGIAQMIATQDIPDLATARQIVSHTFEPLIFEKIEEESIL